MTLYGKGNWTRFTMEPEQWDVFLRFVNNQRALFCASALAARTTILASNEIDSAVGINPPCWPCGDAPMPKEQLSMDQKVHPWLARNLRDEAMESPWELPESVEDETGVCLTGDRYWGSELVNYLIAPEEDQTIGFWLVLLKREGLDDLNALKEHAAATTYHKPLRVLATSSKSDITKSLESDGLVNYIARTQCPVIVDFKNCSIWLGTATKKLVEAFKFWMGRHLQIMISPMEIVMGGSSNWPALALGAMMDGDINKLERAEALERAIKERQDATSTDDEDEETEPTDIPEGDPEADEKKFHLDNLSLFTIKDTSESAIVGLDAIISLGVAGTRSVTAQQAVDALAMLQAIEGSSVAAARVAFVDSVGDGQGTVRVDVSPFLTQATYKGLELEFKAETLPALKDGRVGDDLFENKDLGVVNLYWFRYLGMLEKAERMIIDICAKALTLDHTLIKAKARGAQEAEVTTPEEDGVIHAAVRKLKEGMQTHLLPGESITLTGGGRSVTIPAKGAEEAEVEI